jgi:hypothetical protein
MSARPAHVPADKFAGKWQRIKIKIYTKANEESISFSKKKLK